MAESLTMTGAGQTMAPLYDKRAILERVDGDIDLLREVIEMFLTDAPPLIADMRAAVAAGDAGGIKAAAHTLRGAASNFGATAVVECAREVEALAKSGGLANAAALVDRLEGAHRELETALRMLATDEPEASATG
jgi:HPt (histidine-containing phosphotransfer) domain-containing protein